MRKIRLLILGAAGRDFHNFNVLYRRTHSEEGVHVVGFTATQIPHIDDRMYPPGLSGPLYVAGLKIWREEDLEHVIADKCVDRCMLAYSDLPHQKVMELASRCLAAGAEFVLCPPQRTMIPSSKPVIAVCAVRTGCGKSQVSRYIIDVLEKQLHRKCVLVRHPMPYGDLAKQAVQRFQVMEDLDKHKVTIEEREEYEQHMKRGTVVYAGVDYEAILREAEKEADVVIFDGGNNDTPFFKPDLWICVADPLRAGHERAYYPGTVNMRCADVIVVNKVNTASTDQVEQVKASAQELNPKAPVFTLSSTVDADEPDLIKDKRVLVVEDGPTLTHGEMKFGAGFVAAQKYGAADIIDPHAYLVGSLKETAEKFPHIERVIPAMGYFPEQIKDLEDSINATPCDAVIIATPMDLRKVLNIKHPCAVVTYSVDDAGSPPFLRDTILNMKF